MSTVDFVSPSYRSASSDLTISDDTGCSVLAVDSKVCAACGEEKSVKDFHRNKRKRDGLEHICKPCNKNEVRALKKASGQDGMEVMNGV